MRAAIAMLCVVVSSVWSGCWFDANLKHDLGTTPEPLDDGWEIATPQSVGLPTAALSNIHRELLREDRQLGTLGLMVIKDRKLVWETYLRSMSDRDHYQHVQSVTKSITSLTFGVADDLGVVPALDLSMKALFPDKVEGLDPRKGTITLEQLLTMRSGLAFDNDVFSVEMWVDKPRDPIRYILSKPLYADPGKRYYYRDADPQLVGYAIEKLAGSEGVLAQKTIFAKLGIHDFYWEQGPGGVYLAAHGLHLRPRDLAKIGQLVLDRGEWRGERIVSETWIDAATREQTLSDTRDRHGELYPYGYYFWIVRGVGVAAWGHGGQFVLVVPDRQMVIVQVALPDTDDLQGSNLNDFLELVDPLLR